PARFATQRTVNPRRPPDPSAQKPGHPASVSRRIAPGRAVGAATMRPGAVMPRGTFRRLFIDISSAGDWTTDVPPRNRCKGGRAPDGNPQRARPEPYSIDYKLTTPRI